MVDAPCSDPQAAAHRLPAWIITLADGALVLMVFRLHVWRSAALWTGGRRTAAAGGEGASRTLRGRLRFIFVRGARTPVDWLRGTQLI
jgi:hypothetical protein